MMSLPITFTPAAGRVFASRATKSAGGTSVEEKGFLDWLGNALAKEDQLLEVDPILKKVEGKGSTGSGTKKGTVTVEIPQKKKNGGFGGFFAKQ